MVLDKQNQVAKKLLVVDDERGNLRMMKRLLTLNGYTPICCASGAEALEWLDKDQYAAVLTDIKMPGMDGYELCRSIKTRQPDLPVIIMTALLDDHSLEQGFAHGASDYMRKPISEVELMARLNSVIQAKESKEEIARLYANVLDDLQLATRVQNFILPEWLEFHQEIKSACKYVPVNKVSGDLLDVVDLGQGRYLVYIADVSGHGVRAALQMSAVESLVHEFATNRMVEGSPAEILQDLNAMLCDRLFVDNYMTILMLVVDCPARKIRYYNAGHTPLLAYYPTSQELIMHDFGGGIPLGWDKNFAYLKEDEGEVELVDEMKLLLFTDGIFEAFNREEQEFGQERLIHLIKQGMINEPIQLLPEFLLEQVVAAGFRLSDDVTILALEIFPSDSKEDWYKVPRKLLAVPELGQKIEQRLLNQGWSTRKAAEVELVINELVNNMVMYGRNEADPFNDFIAMHVDEGPDMVCLTIYEQGADWHLPNRTMDEEDELLKERGRGLEIVTSIARSMNKRRLGEVNVITVEIARGGADA